MCINTHEQLLYSEMTLPFLFLTSWRYWGMEWQSFFSRSLKNPACITNRLESSISDPHLAYRHYRPRGKKNHLWWMPSPPRLPLPTFALCVSASCTWLFMILHMFSIQEKSGELLDQSSINFTLQPQSQFVIRQVLWQEIPSYCKLLVALFLKCSLKRAIQDGVVSSSIYCFIPGRMAAH